MANYFNSGSHYLYLFSNVNYCIFFPHPKMLQMSYPGISGSLLQKSPQPFSYRKTDL